MMKWSIALLVVIGAAWVFWPPVYSATARPEADVEITLSIWPMQSLHSDWHRQITVRSGGSRIKMRLFGDTGWWRGSNLYVHSSGAYILHEGQNGCIAFTVNPANFIGVPAGVCNKHDFPETTENPGSRYYRDLTYLGHFSETHQDAEGVRLRFLDPGGTPEVELPEML
ncbi:MAG: hypothetical protein AAF709_25660 [Pseudomonadota bacterium]